MRCADRTPTQTGNRVPPYSGTLVLAWTASTTDGSTARDTESRHLTKPLDTPVTPILTVFQQLYKEHDSPVISGSGAGAQIGGGAEQKRISSPTPIAVR